MLRTLISVLFCSVMAVSQEGAAAPQSPPLPQANSDDARAILWAAIDKTIAYARGTFATRESHDEAMMREAMGNVGFPFGADVVEVAGGWHRYTVWAESDGRKYVKANGRMLAEIDGTWRLRRGVLAGGVPEPFTVDPGYLFTVLKQLPKDARNAVHVEGGKLRGKAMTLLTLKLEQETALEFYDAGAVPGSNGMGGITMFGGLAGMPSPPRPELETYIVFYVDAENGDLNRLAVKTYSTDRMLGGVQVMVNVGGFGGGDEEEEDEAEEVEEEADQGPMKWKRGLPATKPTKLQSVMTFRIDFKKLGLASPPALDDKSKAFLRVR